MIIKSIKTSLSISLFIGISMGCETAVTTKSADNPGYSAEVEARIDRVINNLQVGTEFDNVYESKSLTSQMEKYHTPGVSIAVINEGTVEWARGFGKSDVESGAPVDIHTLFEAGSVSKPIFAMAVMKLKEKRVLDLDKDVNEYLRSWKVPKNGDWQPKISLRQLLSHTAGLTVHGFPGYLKSEPIPTVPQILNGE
ncbi:MAG: beta-lactamase family protein, partial [Cytophagales bacterium]|nr:beta-lactamase family protein [Cytophagales bacterium]